MEKLPISIISPVRNCIDEMPAHARHLRMLSRIAGEIIIVDSDSEDGTLDCLKKELADSGAVFLNHPPGLYPSWNHGISRAKYPFLTVATVGDDLPPESLAKLHEDLETSGCDVVISAPTLLATDGSPSSSKWPVHRIIETLGLVAPLEIPSAIWLALTLGFFPKSPLASSSGNLYRTRVFENNLFPTNCGHRGDVIWGITSARAIRWMVDPTVESFFKFNPPSPHKKHPGMNVITTWRNIILRAFHEESGYMLSSGVPRWLLTELGGALEDSCSSLAVESEYSRIRGGPLPWFLSPRAIRLRQRRRKFKRSGVARNELLDRFMASLDQAL